jgi:ubiquinone/menaquinone biosynthesis C-methylase UbiE
VLSWKTESEHRQLVEEVWNRQCAIEQKNQNRREISGKVVPSLGSPGNFIKPKEQNAMSYPTEPLKEHPSAYFVQDRSNLEEMTRLEIQDSMLTAGMGGVLPELTDAGLLRRVLDVGCGTGGWLMETAKTYPTLEKLVGGDISGTMVEYARAQAKALQLSGRVQFQTMDALRVLEFPAASFDLVNQRLGASWIRRSEWTKLFMEYHRVTRIGGIIRITEASIVESNSPALTALCDLVLETCYCSGRFFARHNDGVIQRLVLLMTMHGIEAVKYREHVLVFQAGTREHHTFFEGMRQLFRVALPFFQKWTRVPSDYEHIYQQVLIEMQAPDFVATWHLLTAWGRRPENGKYLLMRDLQ